MLDDVSVYGLLGNPVRHSLSPIMHRAAFRALGMNAEYVAFQVMDIKHALAGIKGLGIRGASVTIPFKEEVIPLLEGVDPVARKIGAVNTIVNRDGILIGYNTDWMGFKSCISNWMDPEGKSFVILGAGGAARAVLYGVLEIGGEAILLNRDAERAKRVAEEFGCVWHPLEAIKTMEADVLVNTTPVGMWPKDREMPVPRETLRRFQRVVDIIYNPLPTRLLREAEKEGGKTMSGLEMFLHQGAEQFRLWTGMDPPFEVMRKAVLEELQKT